jgi:hypothetical protein
MLAKERGINFFEHTVNKIKEIKIPQILKETKMVRTQAGEIAYQLENGLMVVTKVAEKPISQWNKKTVEYVALCLEALSSNHIQFEPMPEYKDKGTVSFPIKDVWRGWGSIDESDTGEKIFRLNTIAL